MGGLVKTLCLVAIANVLLCASLWAEAQFELELAPIKRKLITGEALPATLTAHYSGTGKIMIDSVDVVVSRPPAGQGDEKPWVTPLTVDETRVTRNRKGTTPIHSAAGILRLDEIHFPLLRRAADGPPPGHPGFVGPGKYLVRVAANGVESNGVEVSISAPAGNNRKAWQELPRELYVKYAFHCAAIPYLDLRVRNKETEARFQELTVLSRFFRAHPDSPYTRSAGAGLCRALRAPPPELGYRKSRYWIEDLPKELRDIYEHSEQVVERVILQRPRSKLRITHPTKRLPVIVLPDAEAMPAKLTWQLVGGLEKVARQPVPAAWWGVYRRAAEGSALVGPKMRPLSLAVLIGEQYTFTLTPRRGRQRKQLVTIVADPEQKLSIGPGAWEMQSPGDK